MPTSLGIMQILVGPPPPPPWDGPCWPTPQAATTRVNVTSRAAPAPLNPHVSLDTFSPPSRYIVLCITGALLLSEYRSLLPSAEKLVEEHGHQEQDAQHEELPGAWYASQGQAVPQSSDDEHAEHGAGYRPRATVDAGPAKDYGGDHVQLQPEPGIAPRRGDPRGVDHRRHAHKQADASVEGQLDLADGHAGETGRLLVVADGVDVAPEASAGQDHPD